jgi:hypothetical protein
MIERVGVRVTVGVNAAIADWRVLCTMMATNTTMTTAVKMKATMRVGRCAATLLARDRRPALLRLQQWQPICAAVHTGLGARRDGGPALRAQPLRFMGGTFRRSRFIGSARFAGTRELI